MQMRIIGFPLFFLALMFAPPHESQDIFFSKRFLILKGVFVPEKAPNFGIFLPERGDTLRFTHDHYSYLMLSKQKEISIYVSKKTGEFQGFSIKMR